MKPKRLMELEDTIDMMKSDDYKERFKAEYYQLKIRIEKLISFIYKYETNQLEFEPETPLFIYKNQLKAMQDYFSCLDIRQATEYIF